jgi:1-acyl-sn-glycerol-3-phosphate acyltransferase
VLSRAFSPGMTSDGESRNHKPMILVRSTLYFLWFVLVTAAVCIVLLPALLMPRGVVRFGTRLWCKSQLWGLRAIAGQRYEVRGPMPRPGSLVAAKHMSMWDTLVLYLLLRDVTIVLKRELLFVPFYAWYALKVGFIFVDRKAGASALRKMVARATEALKGNKTLLIFPEGTRKRPGASPDYKSGIAALYDRLGVACVPVALNSGLYWAGPSGFLKLPGTIVVEFLPTIPPGLKRREFMAELQRRIEGATAGLIAECPAR